MATTNPHFKRKTAPLHRPTSPSPPTAHVEPLSPPRPLPIEPSFNYPPLTHVNYTVQASHAQPGTSHGRTLGASYRNGHYRTPSIDTLAEAALAVSSGSMGHSRSSSTTQPYESNARRPQQYASYGTGEPPHKRARSDLLVSPQLGRFPSRPVTSYEPHAAEQGLYNSRVEEAALLLNFRTGGWPSNGGAMSPPQAPASAAHRPHANSFPRDGHYSRPSHVGQTASLLPPFSTGFFHQSQATLSTSQKSIEESASTAHRPHRMCENQDTLISGPNKSTSERRDLLSSPARQQTQTLPDDRVSSAGSLEIAPSEASDAARSRRGWPKGKPRGTKSRKTIAEQVVAKRAAIARKKVSDNKKVAKKVRILDSVEHDIVVQPGPRRKSMSDATTNMPEHEMSGTRSHSVPTDNIMMIRTSALAKTPKSGKVTAETICAGCRTSRESATANSELDEWISCNGCKKWFHIDCAGFKKALEVKDVDKYFCTSCEAQHGKTTFVRKSARAHASVDYAELQRGVLKTSQDSHEHHYIQPIKDGTFSFDPELFPRLRPEMVTKDFFEKSGTFVEPICIPAAWNPRPWNEEGGMDMEFEAETGQETGSAASNILPHDFEYETAPDVGQDKLGMVMPEGLTVRHVCDLVGADYPLDVIDVKTQNSGQKWNLGRWADYYEQDGDDKPIRNVISLEVSHTRLGRLLRRPQIVRDIDLQDSVWPQEEKNKGKWPKVQYYCLMSVADSYTDFHVDFGGSSVYYHILKGKKTFFFIPPKPKHLKAYEEWNESPQQNFTFLPSITKECYRVDLHEGDTMLIPSGWIHAVWTPETSLVIGGNFLTRMSFKNQFKLVEIEKANHTPMKFRYPFFQRIMWYTVIRYLTEDPLPPAVSDMFNTGQIFERKIPIWQDFDGDVAADDDRPGHRNVRYYSQAELDGLPELMNYIWRTVMSVLGRVEGISEDQKKRINSGIPKGSGLGEPIEIAKKFGKWVAWKRGNEAPPAWSHLDFNVLDIIKEAGRTKRLSARAVKDLERKEAIAAWKIAPDRQSARVMSKTEVVAAPDVATFEDGASSQSPGPLQEATPDSSNIHQQSSHSAVQYTPDAAPPSLLMLAPMGGQQHFSTPKTSVLGPKRVACDACRKRRIKCKHKDSVLTATPELFGHLPGMPDGGSFQSDSGTDAHDNIMVSGTKIAQFMPDGSNHAQLNGFATNGAHVINPGTNAYVNANIPMTMNGVPFFGEGPKKGRTKACYECRKSKRRCVHNDDGTVDPVKASETPIPRGNAKKRSPEADGSPVSMKRVKQDGDNQPTPPAQGGMAGVLMPAKPSPKAKEPKRQNSTQTPPQIVHHPPDDDPQPPELDPSLFEAAYPDPSDHGHYSNHTYPYPMAPEQQQQQSSPYEYPSLEQIASEVLDMNGNADEGDYIDRQLNALSYERLQAQRNAEYFPLGSSGSMHHSVRPKPDESVDSAISLPSSESAAERSVDERLMEAFLTSNHSSHQAIPTVELNGFAHVMMSPVARKSVPTGHGLPTIKVEGVGRGKQQ
ncbi:hypothetical protein LTR62_002743 [Meristemomyces frigidus]|uniref:JmjC domain-containing histone demethylation protein 1 n=1 Tax=Meristemomyces frigidus TaxID=1508187 RepID=A0AAN7YHH0_9PEZI|nr:hypothetical protein LTR62_002743 [Meristemomyces frigidus]